MEGDKILKNLQAGFLNNMIPVRFFTKQNNAMCCRKLPKTETL